LYGYSSTLYPGGSEADLNHLGFDWANNYWCNLMNELAMNGEVNPARPFAISAMMILCLSILVFFIQFARRMATNLFWKKIIPIFGIISMIFAALISTQYHDSMISLSSAFGAIAVLGVIIELYKSSLQLFKFSGAICILLLLLNNIIYYSEFQLEYLPIIQKVTFVIVLSWIVGLNLKMNTD